MTVFLTCCNLLLPLMMVVVGTVFIRRPPKTINGWYGYRTALSMSSPEAWAFAHAHCGRVWVRVGAVLLAVSAGVSAVLLFFSAQAQAMGCLILVTAQTVGMILSISPTQRALRQRFSTPKREGNPQ
ncbi:MAG: SdpI family protein [Eubacteriales bacterium]|nr:SdpI family protein [Eubacteriales bacterium]